MGTLCATIRRSATGGGARPATAAYRLLLLGAVLAACGCADARFLRRTCPQPADRAGAAAAVAPNAQYRVGCPDVLELSFDNHPEWGLLAVVDLDGCLGLEEVGRPRVEGLTVDEARDELARLTGEPADKVHVALAAPRSRQVFVHGPVRGRSRAFPYQGPEPVMSFLTRVGGLPPGSRLNDVYVVRPNVAVGKPPEIFQVDVSAVLLDGDSETNIPLAPSDQVYIGETRGSTLSRFLPHWLGTVFRQVLGLLPDDWWRFGRTPEGSP